MLDILLSSRSFSACRCFPSYLQFYLVIEALLNLVSDSFPLRCLQQEYDELLQHAVIFPTFPTGVLPETLADVQQHMTSAQPIPKGTSASGAGQQASASSAVDARRDVNGGINGGLNGAPETPTQQTALSTDLPFTCQLPVELSSFCMVFKRANALLFYDNVHVLYGRTLLHRTVPWTYMAYGRFSSRDSICHELECNKRRNCPVVLVRHRRPE